tara:strand:+ start:29897 stop:30769 length:873 start_codon:yes stop_codon:yes gene_type:complete
MEEQNKKMQVNVSPNTGLPQLFSPINDTIYKVNPTILFVLCLIIILYYTIFSYLGEPSASMEPMKVSKGLNSLEILLWGLFLFLVMVNGLQYFFNLDIKASIKNLFTETPEVDITLTSPDEITEQEEESEEKQRTKPQVFHVSGNDYTYDDAKAVCKAYDSKLANYKQIEESYQKGGEWCSYGWSDNQMALFPTQQETWNKLQKIKGHKNDCGRPGINGGYIDNKNVRFGVNCFGTKPEASADELNLLNNATAMPLTKEERLLDAKVAKYKKNIDQILVSPFNYSNWSQV